MIVFHCPTCHKQFNASNAMAGRELKCGDCNAVIIVPSSPPDPRLPAVNKGAAKDEALDKFIAEVQTNSTANVDGSAEQRSSRAANSSRKHTVPTDSASHGTPSTTPGWPLWKSLGILVACVVAFLSCNRDNAGPRPENATIQYWAKLQHLTSSLSPGNSTPEGFAHRLDNAASAAANLPTIGVDRDAVMCGLALAQFLRNTAAFIQATNDGMLIVDLMIRVAQGDPFGTYNEVQVANQALYSEYDNVRKRCTAARAVLTARYQTEFPPLNL